MGAWGSGLYANDTACDIRDIYMQCLQDGMDDLQAYEKTIAECADYLSDDLDAPLVWYALAETQWKMGRLMPEVKENALKWIDKNGGIDPWLETVNKGMGWMKTLDHLRDKLLSPIPKRKALPKERDVLGWKVGDVFMYPLRGEAAREAHLDDCSLLLFVAGHYKISHLVYPIFYRLIWLEERMPQSAEEISAAGFLRTRRYTIFPKEKAMYRLNLLANKQADLRAFNEQCRFVGNFTDIRTPDDEVDLPDHSWGMIEPERMEIEACYAFHHYDIYYARKS